MSAKNVLFVHRYGPTFASYRYRSQIPAEQVAKHNGFKTGLNEPGDYDVIVLSKPCKEDLPLIEQVKAQGATIIGDFADDHFEGKKAEVFYEIAGKCDYIVTATDVMRDRVHGYLKRDAVVISDPYEQDEKEPHADGDEFLWFGHQTNLPDLTAITPLLKGRSLKVVSGPRDIRGVIPWTPENMQAAFRQSNIVLLPTRPGAEFKSPNRLINSLRAGCFAVCAKHPSYFEFRDFVWVGNMPTGLKWTDAFKSELNTLVKAGQDYIRERYSPEKIGKQWAQLLEAA